MWTIVERVMAIIGFIATVGGTVIAYYAFVQPADLSNDLSKIAERLSSEPALQEYERVYVGQVLDMGANYLIYIEKQTTNATGTVELKICDPQSGSSLGDGKFSFGREATDFTPQFKGGLGAINIVLTTAVGSNSFSRKEEWRNSNGNWARVSEPSFAIGKSQSCR